MRNLNKYIINFFLNAPLYRKVLIIFLDVSTVFVSLIIYSLLLNKDINSFDFVRGENNIAYLILSLLLVIPLYYFTGQYRSLTRYLGSITLYFIAIRNFIIVSILYLLNIIYVGKFLPIVYPLVLWLLITSISSALRLILRDLLIVFKKKSKIRLRVAIYGAGDAGIQLANSLRISNDYQITCFIDDSIKLIGKNINGIPIIKLESITKYKNEIKKILLAIPSLEPKRRVEILGSIQKYNLPVFQIPSIEELAKGNKTIDNLKPIPIEELLCRPSAIAIKEFLVPPIKEKNILITGAGGSIGSQLCKEVIELSPKMLLMIDNSEENLYLIDQLLKEGLNQNIKVVSILGDICNENFVNYIFSNYHINTVFHAAAYKHVPLVEFNPISGLSNNYKSTRTIAKASMKYGVNNFTLISSDKAVRPTSIMGASKRLSELIVQACAEEESYKNETTINKTIFSMVRFGNVLGSSGSVVKLFSKQIKRGGPVTLTHPKMIRYFMTIKEASQLVIQSSSLSKGGDLFLLDMGKPVKIKSLAEQMIYLNGLKVKDENHQNGDIEIVNVGLRPGEKLYEELLIDAKSLPTKHPLIFKANEKFIKPEELWKELEELDYFVDNYDFEKTLRKMGKLVKEWKNQKVQND